MIAIMDKLESQLQVVDPSNNKTDLAKITIEEVDGQRFAEATINGKTLRVGPLISGKENETPGWDDLIRFVCSRAIEIVTN